MAQPVGALVNAYEIPAMREIAAITNSVEAVVTTTFDHGYLTGGIVRLYIPNYFGMTQANRLKGSITVLTATTFSITIDTSFFDPFVIPTYIPEPAPYTSAQVVPIGEDTDHLDSSFRNILTPLS